MNTAEFATFAAALQTYFPRYNLLPNRQAMDLWYMELRDIPAEAIMAALRKWISTEKWPPSIAEIRELCSEVQEGKLPDWGESWAEVAHAIRRFGWARPEEALASMSPTTQAAVKRIGWMELCQSENPETIRAQYRQIYEIVSKRAVEERKMPTELKAVIQNIQIGRGAVPALKEGTREERK